MGATPLRGGVVKHIYDLCRHVAEISSSAILFFSASYQCDPIRLYHVALHVAHTMAGRGGLAGHKIPIGGTKKGNSLS